MGRRSKYGAIATTVDGIRFPSMLEAERYSILRLAEKAGQITNLELQPRYDITVNGKNIAFYRADFRYFDKSKNAQITEDCKGMVTDIYRLKKKAVEAQYGIEIIEVTKKTLPTHGWAYRKRVKAA